MEPVIVTSTTQGATGNLEISGLPYIPSYSQFIITKKHNTTENFIRKSEGDTDGTTKVCYSFFWDGAGKSERFTDRLINVLGRDGSGVLQNIIVADSVTFVDHGGGDYRMNLNFTASVSGYKLEARLFP